MQVRNLNVERSKGGWMMLGGFGEFFFFSFGTQNGEVPTERALNKEQRAISGEAAVNNF